MNGALLLIVIGSLAATGWMPADAKLNSCSEVMVALPETNPLILTDKNGRKCRSNFLVPFCKGFCFSKEYGTHKFPFRNQKSYVCTLEAGYMATVNMTDCDQDADSSIRTYKIPRNNRCICKECDSSQTMCLNNNFLDFDTPTAD